MKLPAIQHLQTRLFLHAVFPTLDDVIKASPAARALIEQSGDFSVLFRTRSGLRASYRFTPHGCHYSPGDSDLAGIALYFWSDGQAAATFLERRALPPIPTRGFGELSKMKTFAALGAEMRKWLKPSDEQLADDGFRRTFAMMSLGLALRGVVQLGRFERKSCLTVQNGPQGVLAFRIEGSDQLAWLNLKFDELSSGAEKPPTEPDVEVVFRDSTIAARAVTNQLDSMAAVGRGDIKIHGLVPLADSANALMDRVQPLVDSEKAI